MATWGLTKKDEPMGDPSEPAAKKVKGGAAAAAAQPGEKRKAGGGSTASPKKTAGPQKSGEKRMSNPPRYKDLLGQTVENSRNIAFLMAVTFYTVLIPKTSSFIKTALSIGKQYFEQTKGKKNHGMGSPHLHVFNSLVAEVKERIDLQSDEEWHVDAWVDDTGSSLEKMEEAIQVCRVTRTFDQDVYKLMFNGHPKADEMIKIMLRCMETDGGTVKRSVAPKGPRERRLEEWLRRGQNAAEEEDE